MSRRGYGRSGYCKLCASEHADKLVRWARAGWNAKKAQEAAEELGIEFSRQTWYSHVKHAQTADRRLVQAAQQVRESGSLTLRDIAKTNNTDALEAIRDLAIKRALENPEDVTINHGLKAMALLEKRREQAESPLNVLVRFMTGQPPAFVIEGEAREVPGDEED